MIRIMTTVLMICLFTATAWAQDADESEKSEITGTLEMGVRIVDDNSDGSKSEEYRDMDSGAWGSAWIRANQENNYILFEGNNIALDDQSYKIEGGKYDHFKFTLFFDETPIILRKTQDRILTAPEATC